MTSHSDYALRSGRSYHPSLVRIAAAADQFGTKTRRMGPPSDFLPQPVEMDIQLHVPRTLPAPAALASTVWDASLPLPSQAYGAYGSDVLARTHESTVNNHNRAQDPIHNWYTAQDGPWVPRQTIPDDSTHVSQTGNIPMPFGNQYRQSLPSEAGSFHIRVAPSDSGYGTGTRKSVGNTSVFSGDFPEREQDSQNLVNLNQEYPSLHAYDALLQPPELRTAGSWASRDTTSISETSVLLCLVCGKVVKTQSDLKKHDLRHTKPHTCKVPGCTRTKGFPTVNDLDRHTNSKHPDRAVGKRYQCLVPGCKSKSKAWPRLDNFRSHLRRAHRDKQDQDGFEEDMVRRGACSDTIKFKEQHEPSNSTEDVLSVESGNDSASLSRHGEVQWIEESQTIDPSLIDEAPSETPSTADRSERSLQPLEIDPRGRLPERKAQLDQRLSAPVSCEPESDRHPLSREVDPEQAARQTSTTESASVAKVTEGFGTTDHVDAMLDAPARSPLPDVKVTRQTTGLPLLPTEEPVIGCNGQTQSTDEVKSALINATSNDLDNTEKDLDDLKRLASRLGYTVQKTPLPPSSPRIQNAGSVASKKSELQVTCQRCKKFRGRPCELRKHMKRHDRPYGCTFVGNCKKSFGSKNDWKRHENSQHYHIEAWRCNIARDSNRDAPCSKVCYQQTTFAEHLRRDHHMPSDSEQEKAAISAKAESCRIGRNCQARFWCGFCRHLIDLRKTSLEAWNERFDHIDDHFMGKEGGKKGFKEWNINDWVPVDAHEADDNDEMLSASSSSRSPDHFEDSPRESLSDAEETSNGPRKDTADAASSSTHCSASPAFLILLDNTGRPPTSAVSRGPISSEMPRTSGKRKPDGSIDDGGRPRKLPRSTPKLERRVICCQCNYDANPKLNAACLNADCSRPHEFSKCKNCKWEVQEAPE